MKIALLIGGPSPERGISLNSARSVLDHLESDKIEIIPIYFDYKKTPYLISRSQLYSNTPSDFDFKLHKNAKSLTAKTLLNLLKKVDLAFPVMHGVFGEDGQIQRYLEKNNIPYIGSPSSACKIAFDKFNANEFIKSRGYFTQPSVAIDIKNKNKDSIIKEFFKKNNIKQAVVKPAIGGSSIGVFSVSNIKEAITKKNFLLNSGLYKKAVVEPFCKGIEFTVIILQNYEGEPVAILPTEIETSYLNHQIFDYRKKYLPTNQVRYHYPPRFAKSIINNIRKNAEEIFLAFGMRDFARFDGWVLKNGEIWFSDFNPVSGMEQNSFLFQQSTRVGMGHRNVLRYIVKNACLRYGIKFPDNIKFKVNNGKKPVNVLFGGSDSERQVSLMSGTNVWLKLKKSKKYSPKPYLLDSKNNVWELPYAFAINHTVEDVLRQCKGIKSDFSKLNDLTNNVKKRLKLTGYESQDKIFLPKEQSLSNFIKNSRYVFIGLHGGVGEDVTIQKMLEKKRVKYNGSDSSTSKICLNKWVTGQFIRKLNLDGLSPAPQKLIKVNDIVKIKDTWNLLVKDFKGKETIVKPVSDGCSTGVAKLNSYKDLEKYLRIIKNGQSYIPKNTLGRQGDIIEMPLSKVNELLFEKYIKTDVIYVENNKLIIKSKTGWNEVTVGVLEENGKYHALNPSLTIAEGGVLSLEEKFQGGTGVNITPPTEIASQFAIAKTKKLIEKLAKSIGIKDYARIDAFMNVNSGDLIIIEVNTLPGLTPSTVIYHQALAEKKPMFPTAFLEKIIENSGY